MTKKVYYTSEKDLEGIKWTAKVIDFGVGLMVSAAINEMYNAYAMAIDRKDIMRGKVKYCCNNAFREAKRTETAIRMNMRSRKFWADYSDAVIDEALNDITLFRIAVKQTLDDQDVKESEFFAYVETARVMLNMAVESFRCFMEQAKAHFGKNYTDMFSEYNVNGIFYWWGQMCDILYKGQTASINNDKTHGMFDRLCKKFAEGEYINACLEQAQASNPDFTDSKVEVVG